ncbi:MAG: hypothetical protein K5683_08570 [Prevotella sp.]|nr:hypothetical protein [Prevotella sp.]
MSTTFTACSDDDDNNNDSSKNSEQKQQEQEDRIEKFWSVASQLVGSDVYTTDYEGQTFEPTIGNPDSDGSLVRVVQTNDLQTAAQRFANLTGATIDENTPSYTYDDPDVGTLTYTRVADGNVWATVDVDIKQIPHLQQIVYRASSGENGSFGNVKAYYRFGDIVMRTLNGKQEYWICVRPAFSYEGKEESHWVCVNSLPAKNIFHYKGSNGNDYYVPTGIGEDKENMQNFTEMLFAIFRSNEWESNLRNHQDGLLWGYSGMPIFGDFSRKNADYHNSYFWSHVKQAWYYLGRRDNLVKKAIGLDYETLSEYMTKGDSPAVNLLYKGYSWLTAFSWNLTLNEAEYRNGTGKEANMHDADYLKIKNDVSDSRVDVCSDVSNTQNYYGFFVDDLYHWVIRHATGKQLNGGRKLSPEQAIGNGFSTAYRYYDYYPEEYARMTNGHHGPEVSEAFGPELAGELRPGLDAPAIGTIIGADGKFYENTSSANQYGNGAVSIVCALNGEDYVEQSTHYNGLAMGIEMMDGELWIDGDDEVDENCMKYMYEDDYTGRAATAHLANGCGAGHNHPIAKKLSNGDYPRRFNQDVAASGKFSNWFIPSLGQWALAMKSFGLSWDEDRDTYAAFKHMDEIDGLRKRLRTAGIRWEDNYSTEKL